MFDLIADAYVAHYPVAPAINKDSPDNVAISRISVRAVVISVGAAVVVRSANRGA